MTDNKNTAYFVAAPATAWNKCVLRFVLLRQCLALSFTGTNVLFIL
jgi:hypothetical protein